MAIDQAELERAIELWWFAGGEGERRLQNVFDERFGKDLGDSR